MLQLLNPPTSPTYRDRLNAADPNTLADLLRGIGLGDLIRSFKTPLYNQAPVANPYDAATAAVIVLPDDAKAETLLSAYVRAGTSPGTQLVCEAAVAAAPSAGGACITPAGNIAVLAADGATEIDCTYLPGLWDVYEVIANVNPATGAVTLPTTWSEDVNGNSVLVVLLEAQSLAGTTISKMIVDPAGTATATGHARLDAAKANVLFAVADAVTQARVKVAVASGIDFNALLEGPAPY